MKLTHVLPIACTLIAAPGMAADSAYDVLIVACDRIACKRVVEQRLLGGLANIAEFNRAGLKLMIETLARRGNEEDTRVSVNLHPAEDGSGTARPTPASLAQRLETLRVTLKHETFSPLTSFVSDGTTYQIWARVAAIR